MWCSKTRTSYMSSLLLQHQSGVEIQVEERWLGVHDRRTFVTDWSSQEPIWDYYSLHADESLRLD